MENSEDKVLMDLKKVPLESERREIRKRRRNRVLCALLCLFFLVLGFFAGSLTNETAASSGDGTRYYLYRYPVTISYTTTYQGLKQAINYINNYGERMTIDSVSVAFDESTGLLEGTMVLNLYTLSDSVKPHYTIPQISGIPIGNPNIFGTYQ